MPPHVFAPKWIPKKIFFMYWHQGCVNAATVSIQREGAKGQIHICEGATTYFKNNSSNIFSCICVSANTGPICMCAKINSSRFFSCMYWFLCRGVMREGPGVKTSIFWSGFWTGWGPFWLPAPSPSPLVRQACEHPAFCVTSSALFRQNSGIFSHLLDNLLGPFSGIFRQYKAISGNLRFFWCVFLAKNLGLQKNKEGWGLHT